MGKKRPAGLDPHGAGIRIRIQNKGQRYAEVIPGDYYNARDLAAAERRREILKSRLALGLPIHDTEDGERSLFAEDCQSYLNALDVDYSTSIDYEGALNRHWLPTFARRITQTIRTKEIKQVLTATGLSSKRKRNILIPLRGVFEWAEVTPNPAHLKVKRGDKRAIQRWRPAERQALMDAIDAQGDAQTSAYFALLFGCGLRPGGEPLGLQWPDWDGTRIHVHRTIVRRRIKPTSKTHEDRYVYVPTWVRPYIKALPSQFKGGWLFLNSRGTHYLDSDVFNAAWAKVFDTKRVKHDLKLGYQVPYVCRHTRAAELLSTGVDPAKAAKQLGHSLEMFYRTYSEWIDEYAQSSDDELEGVVQKRSHDYEEKEKVK